MRKIGASELVLACFAVACVPDFTTDLSQLGEPRLLAISATPAETQAGQETTLTALVAVPETAERPEVKWTMCLARKPLTELGPVDPLCLRAHDDSGAVQPLGQGLSVSVTLDKDACKLFGPLRPPAMGNEAAGRPVDPDITGGFYQPFVASLGGVPSLGAVRLACDLANVNRDEALSYRRQYRSNENPAVSELAYFDSGAPRALDAGESPLEITAGERLRLRASWDVCPDQSSCGDGLCTANEDESNCPDDCNARPRGCTGAEHYVWYNRERERVEARREGISVAWYASRGHFDHEQTGLDEAQAATQRFTENTYVASLEAGPATLWLVIRDTRGGQTWRVQRLAVRP